MSHRREFVVLSVVALIAAILRFFMQGWVESAGISLKTGSFFASIDLVLLAGFLIIFIREGVAVTRRYWRAAGWYVLLAAWCTVLVIAGILTTAATGSTTYYQDTMGRNPQPTPVHHAMMHAIAFLPIAAIGLLLGAAIYGLAGLARPGKPAMAS